MLSPLSLLSLFVFLILAFFLSFSRCRLNVLCVFLFTQSDVFQTANETFSAEATLKCLGDLEQHSAATASLAVSVVGRPRTNSMQCIT